MKKKSDLVKSTEKLALRNKSKQVKQKKFIGCGWNLVSEGLHILHIPRRKQVALLMNKTGTAYEVLGYFVDEKSALITMDWIQKVCLLADAYLHTAQHGGICDLMRADGWCEYAKTVCAQRDRKLCYRLKGILGVK